MLRECYGESYGSATRKATVMLRDYAGNVTGVLRECYGSASGGNSTGKAVYGSVTGLRWECYGSNTDVIRECSRSATGKVAGMLREMLRQCYGSATGKVMGVLWDDAVSVTGVVREYYGTMLGILRD